MARSLWLPYEFVNYLTKPGLPTTAGDIPLNAYMCKTLSNGGNDNTANLFKNMMLFKDGGNGTKLLHMFPDHRLDILIKGQGRPEDFITVWNFMLRNKDLLDTYKMPLCHRDDKKPYALTEVLPKKTIIKHFFEGRTDAEALKLMVKNRFFGIDCLGFLANFLIFCGVYDKYVAHVPADWNKVFSNPISKARDIKPLDLLYFYDHVALIDWVWDQSDDKTARVDICQSSSGGPQCNEYVYIREVPGQNYRGYPRFKIVGGGTPKMPVDHDFAILRMPGLYY